MESQRAKRMCIGLRNTLDPPNGTDEVKTQAEYSNCSISARHPAKRSDVVGILEQKNRIIVEGIREEIAAEARRKERPERVRPQ